MPKAAPETTVTPSPGQVRRDLAGHRGAVRRRRAGPDHRDGPGEQLVETAGAPHPQPERCPAPPVELARRGRGRRAGGATRRRRGTTNRMPWRGGRVEVAGRVEAPQPGGHVGGQPATRRAPTRRWSATSAAPSSATSEASRGSPGSASRPSATRASRSASGWPPRALTGRPAGVSELTSSGSPVAQPQRHVDLVGAGPVEPAQVGDRPGEPVDPRRRLDRSAAGGTSGVRAAGHRLGQRPPLAAAPVPARRR